MKILPPVLEPWRDPIERRHSPAERSSYYRAYRPCLRWEFGFTCPFCLCHEADFAPLGAEGLGIMQIEHFNPVSRKGSHQYANCLLACRLCNRARSAKLNVDSEKGSRLLNPCQDRWAEHFHLVEDEIRPVESDADATYTHVSYDLNDPRKIEKRYDRRETIEECLALLESSSPLNERLLEKAATTHDPDLVKAAKKMEAGLHLAWRDLQSYEAIPRDAPQRCDCGDPELCSIPRHLDEQTLEVDL